MAASLPSRWLFDLWSRTYDNPLLQAVTYKPVHDAVATALRQQRPSRVVDVGCGTGQLTARLANQLGAIVVGCDYSWGMLGQAVRRGGATGWLQADALRLPIDAETADAIVCTESFHWYRDQPGALREFGRVLRPGGRLYVALVNPPTDVVGRGLQRWSERAGAPFYWPTPVEMRAMAVDAGLRVVEQRHLRRLPSTWLFPPVLTIAERAAPAA